MAVARNKRGSVLGKSEKISESDSPLFSPVKTGLGGVKMVSTMIDFLTSEFHRCRDECFRMVGLYELAESKMAFLKSFVAFRSEEMVKSLLRVSDLKYDNEKLKPQEFTFAKFRRNLDRMSVILAARSVADLCPGDIVKLYEYKTLLSSGRKLTRNVTNRFPKQLRAWFSRVFIFYMTFNTEEMGALQPYPGPERRISGDTESVAVRSCQSRHHYYPSKVDFLCQRGIADTEAGTKTFARKKPEGLPLDSSPCIPARNWLGTILQEQTLVEESLGGLAWKSSSPRKKSYELAGVFRSLFWSYLCSPLLREESDGIWDSILFDPTTKQFRDTDTADSYRKQWKSLPDFFRRMLDPAFFSRDIWDFDSPLRESEVIISRTDELLKVTDKERSLFFEQSGGPDVQSGSITRHVWPVTVWSQKPQNNFGFNGSFSFEYPLFAEWAYRFDLE